MFTLGGVISPNCSQALDPPSALERSAGGVVCERKPLVKSLVVQAEFFKGPFRLVYMQLVYMQLQLVRKLKQLSLSVYTKFSNTHLV